MPQKTVEQMVYNRLPFLAVTPQNSELISDFKQEMYYYLQPWTRFADDIVEEDSSYRGLRRMLVAELTAHTILKRKIVTNLGGVGGSSSSGGKHIKKGKADVVEAEFEYAKAGDGNELLMESVDLIAEIKATYCKYGYSLGYYLPDCEKKIPFTMPSFVSFVPDDNTGNTETVDDISYLTP